MNVFRSYALRIRWMHTVIFLSIAVLVTGLLIHHTRKMAKIGNTPLVDDIILITIDALRPDHLGCYGYRRDTSPNIDRFSQEAVLFTDAISQSASTWPSITTLITSLYPSTHQVFFQDQCLPDAVPTLPAILKKNGYLTCFISGHGGMGFMTDCSKHEVFDSYYDAYLVKADVITAKAIDWLEKYRDKKKFLWLHYFDTHVPYNPSEGHKDRYRGDGLYRTDKTVEIETADSAPEGRGKIPRSVAENNITSVDYYIAKYDSAIHTVDEQVGILLNKVYRYAQGRKTLIIITADHGEYLGERNRFFCHGDPYDVNIKVPLILKYDNVFPRSIIGTQVSLVDIMPTILVLAGARGVSRMEGTSLLPVIIGNANGQEYVFSEFAYNQKKALRVSVRAARHKLIYDIEEKMYELYNLIDDPGESVNLFNRDKKQFRRLNSILKKWMARSRRSLAPRPRTLSTSDVEQLKALGYLQ